MRWKIETLHKILKSACHAEDSRLRTAQRLTNLTALFCILSWRIFWLTMLNRAAPAAPATLTITPVEVDLLNKLAPAVEHQDRNRPTLSNCLTQLARLGGYLARASDPPRTDKCASESRRLGSRIPLLASISPQTFSVKTLSKDDRAADLFLCGYD